MDISSKLVRAIHGDDGVTQTALAATTAVRFIAAGAGHP